MSKLKHSVMLLFLMSVSNSSYSQEDVDIAQSALDHVAEKYCSVNAEIYQRCFNLDEAQCRQVYQGIIETCRQNDDGFPIQDDAQAISAFKDCAVTAFLSYLESTGLDLEASCEQSGGELDNTKEDARNIQHPITEPVQNVASQLNENPSDEKKTHAHFCWKAKGVFL